MEFVLAGTGPMVMRDTQLVWSSSAWELQVCEEWQVKDGLVGKVGECILAAFHFNKFTECRWVSVGGSFASLLVGLALGLDKLVGCCVSSTPQGSTNYHWKAFQNTGVWQHHPSRIRS